MDFDPHVIQEILQKIKQQMRCPQCGGEVPINFNNIQVLAEDAMILQLKCGGCGAYIVLHASLTGIENVGAGITNEDPKKNASSHLELCSGELKMLAGAISQCGGSFTELFKKIEEQQEKK